MPVRKYRSVDGVPSNAVIESEGPAAGLRAAGVEPATSRL